MVCGVAGNVDMLIVGRALQGFSAALMLSTYAVLIAFTFPPERHGVALGTCAAVAAVFLALGPFIGGMFSYYLSWRWIFLINIPFGIASLFFLFRAVEKDKPQHGHRFDWSGLVLYILGFGLLVFVLMQSILWGWHNKLTQGLLLLSVIVLFVFYKKEKQTNDPLLDFNLFKIKRFLAGVLILLATQVVVMSLTYWAIWLQQSLHLSVLMAGVGLLPAGLPILVMARVGGHWLDRSGPFKPIATGSVVVLAGMLWLALTAHYDSYWLAFVGFLLYGLGAPLIISPAIAVSLGSAPDSQKGAAAGVMNTMRQTGAALCFAIVGVAISHAYLQHANYTQAFIIGMWVVVIFAAISVLAAWFGLAKK